MTRTLPPLLLMMTFACGDVTPGPEDTTGNAPGPEFVSDPPEDDTDEVEEDQDDESPLMGETSGEPSHDGCYRGMFYAPSDTHCRLHWNCPDELERYVDCDRVGDVTLCKCVGAGPDNSAQFAEDVCSRAYDWVDRLRTMCEWPREIVSDNGCATTAPQSTVSDCARAVMCDSGHEFEVSCDESADGAVCMCLENGANTGSFESPQACASEEDQLAWMNAGCGWSLNP